MDTYLEALRKVRTPIVYDAVERFNVRPRSEGYTDSSIRCILPGLGAMVGYACTAKMVAELLPAEGECSVPSEAVWQYVSSAKRPSVIAVQDLDQPPARGCAWGDLAASIFLNLGCVGAVTNGGVRDIREVEKLGFHLFAQTPVVGHANIRFVEIDTPLKIGSLIVRPGDLLHGDEHGVMVIPREISLPDLLRVIDAFLSSEKTIVDYCTGPNFDLQELIHLVALHEERVGGHWKVLVREKK